MPLVLQLRGHGASSRKPLTSVSGQRQHTCLYLVLPSNQSLLKAEITEKRRSKSICYNFSEQVSATKYRFQSRNFLDTEPYVTSL